MRRPSVLVARRTDGGGVELRVTYARTMRRWGLGQDMHASEAEWDAPRRRFSRRKKGATALNAVLDATEARARAVVNELMAAGKWSWDAFARRFTGAGGDDDVIAYMEAIVNELEAQDRVGNADVYRDTKQTLLRYTGGKALPWDALDAALLYKLDAMLRKEGSANGGIAVCMRTVRAVVNRAMKEGVVPPERYPFATPRTAGYEMKLLKRQKVSRALSTEELARWKAFPFAEHPRLAPYVHLWFVSYYARGMNVVDLAELRTPRDVQGGRIRYRRKKTVRRVVKVLSIPLRGELAAHLAAMPPGMDGYLLPILSAKHATERQKKTRVERYLKEMNAALREAAAIVGIPSEGMTSYTARHTYAMQLMRTGVERGKIGEALGHANAASSEPYLAQFDDDALDSTDAHL